jgi:dipeptidyl aminopeptidase/acylaminoacyl peptidase
MTRSVLANDSVGSRAGSNRDGLGVDRVDTTTLAWEAVEVPRRAAAGYISDGRGQVRILQTLDLAADTSLAAAAPVYSPRAGTVIGLRNFLYRRAGQHNWLPLSRYNVIDETGFFPAAVDPDKDIAYGYARTEGRQALHSIALDGSLKEALVFARPGVDVDSIVRIGTHNRVVGVSLATDRREVVYLDPELAALQTSLAKAIPNQPMVAIVDASRDEQRLLVRAGSDTDAGVFYLYDRARKSLDTLYVARPEMEGAILPAVMPVSFPAADGRQVAAYLTLPPGRTMATARGLKAVVVPDGGPVSRDVWGLDWLSHFLASQGYAVLRPSARGYSGAADMWFRDNDVTSWQRAVDEVLDGGRWLAKLGIAAPAKLGVVGWSHGGYMALQAAATDPSLFKAVVAIAPVTDLAQFKEDRRLWSNSQVINAEIGSGEPIRAASPAQNAARIKAPVLMFHGTNDIMFRHRQSTAMAARLQAAGVPHELVSFDKLDHALDDSTARAGMLRKIDGFLVGAGVR